jgi:hypothetical protein
MRTIGIAAVIGQWVHVRTVKQIIWLTRILQPNRNNCIDLYARILHADSVVMAWLISNWLLYSTYLHLYVGLARTVYIHRIWPYIWWFPCQKYRIYTVYIWFWPTLFVRHTALLPCTQYCWYAWKLRSSQLCCVCTAYSLLPCPLLEKLVSVQVLSSKSVFLFKSSPRKACSCSSPLLEKRVPVQVLSLKSVFLFKSSPQKACSCSMCSITTRNALDIINKQPKRTHTAPVAKQKKETDDKAGNTQFNTIEIEMHTFLYCYLYCSLCDQGVRVSNQFISPVHYIIRTTCTLPHNTAGHC